MTTTSSSELPNDAGIVNIESLGHPLVVPVPDTRQVVGHIEPPTAATVSLEWRKHATAPFVRLGSQYIPPDTPSFEFPRVPLGEARLTAVGVDNSTAQATMILQEKIAPEVVLRLGHGYTISGQVTSGPGIPVTDTAVFISSGMPKTAQPQFETYRSWVVRTGPNGFFQATALPEGTYSLEVLNGLENRPWRIPPDRGDPTSPSFVRLGATQNTAGVNLDVTPCDGVVSGVAIDPAGERIQGAIVNLDVNLGPGAPILEARTSPSGEFQFAGLCGPARTVRIVDFGKHASTEQLVEPGVPTTLTLTPEVSAKFRFADHGNTTMEFTSLLGWTQRVSFTGPDLLLKGLQPAVYRFAVTNPRGYAYAVMDVSQLADAPYSFELKRWAAIAGRLVTPDGRGVPGVRALVELHFEAPEASDLFHRHLVAETTTDANGAFLLSGLLEGTGRVSFWSTGALTHEGPADTRTPHDVLPGAELVVSASTVAGAVTDLGSMSIVAQTLP
jgi:hypothetical protein